VSSARQQYQLPILTNLQAARPYPNENETNWCSVLSGIAPGNRLVDQGFEFVTLPPCSDRLWGLPILLSSGYQGLFPGVKAAGV
jgi:hypothetical protein